MKTGMNGVLVSMILVAAGGCTATLKESTTQGAPTSAGATTAAAASDGWRRDFSVGKDRLADSGVSPYWNLTPGTVSTFKEGDTTLVITVLEQTEMVDGVKTRIVEEREEANGKRKETSRNFFAIDRTNNDVYYFGEVVTEWDAQGHESHPGQWRSGRDGAHFGLMMPGAARQGDKFYQELAPGKAMDRFEVISMDETLTVPAGTFQHVVHMQETTPLENDIGHKWYAPGVGLIKDGEMVLVSSGKK